MTGPRPLPPLEPERYELSAAPRYHFELDRRDLFKTLGFGLLVLFAPGDAEAQRGGGEGPTDIGAWLHVGETGAVRVFTGKTEVGQNIRTSLAQAVAEELRLPLESIQMVMADTDLVPFDMGTFGSRTTPFMAPVLRKAAAAARETLTALAAQQWNVERSQVGAANGRVSHAASGRSLSYAELAQGKRLTETIAADSALAPAAQWKLAGQSVPKVNGRDFVTGRHRYTSDMRLPGMLIGKVLRPPSFGATLFSLDDREAAKIPGVTVVRDGNFAGVTAPDEATAERALAALKPNWKLSDELPAARLFEHLRSQGTQGEGGQNTGSLEQALADAKHKLRQSYTVAYIAHCPLEPRAAVAEWRDGKVTVWTGSQRPFGVRTELVEAFGVTEKQVRVIIPDTGSGYGGKHSGDAAVEAARLARAAGKPVRLVWTREEEFTWAYFRPAGVIDVVAGVREDGALSAWEFHNYNSGAAAIRPYYEIPNQRLQFHPSRSPLRQGSYRALAATANHFARESAIDELAHLAGLDPLEFRRRNLKEPRLRAVVDAAAERFGWTRTRPQGRGYGIACGFEKGGYIATCAEVDVDAAGRLKVNRLVTAFDCGAVVNPEHLRNQIDGSVLMGLGGALFEQVEFDRGRILNPHLSGYRVPRFSDIPQLETVLLDRKDQPSFGSGETPIVGVAPAIANAIYQASGVRLRALPLASKGTVRG